MAIANVIQFPMRHGPVTEREHAQRCVQDAANELFHRQVDAERASRMAELLIKRKRLKKEVHAKQVMEDHLMDAIKAEMCSPGTLQGHADPRHDLSPDARRELEKLGWMLAAKIEARKKK